MNDEKNSIFTCRFCGETADIDRRSVFKHFTGCEQLLKSIGFKKRIEDSYINTIVRGKRVGVCMMFYIYNTGTKVFDKNLLCVCADEALSPESIEEKIADALNIQKAEEAETETRAESEKVFESLEQCDRLNVTEENFRSIFSSAPVMPLTAEIRGEKILFIVKKMFRYDMTDESGEVAEVVGSGHVEADDFFVPDPPMWEERIDDSQADTDADIDIDDGDDVSAMLPSARALLAWGYTKSITKKAEPDNHAVRINKDGNTFYEGIVTPELQEIFAKVTEANKNLQNKNAHDMFKKLNMHELRMMLNNSGYVPEAGEPLTKQQLVEILASGKHLYESAVKYLTFDQRHILYSLMEHNGTMPYDLNDSWHYATMFARGMLQCGTDEASADIVRIPKEFEFIYNRILKDKEINERLKKEYRISCKINAIIYAYGMVTIEYLYDVYKSVFGSEDNFESYEEFEDYVWNCYATSDNTIAVGRPFLRKGGKESGWEKRYIFHERIESPAKMLKRIAKNKNIDYKVFPKEFFEECGEAPYVEFNQTAIDVCVHIANYLEVPDEQMANLLTNQLYNLVIFWTKRGESARMITDSIVKHLCMERKEIETIFQQIKTVVNETELWETKGHTISEAASVLRKKTLVFEQDKQVQK